MLPEAKNNPEHRELAKCTARFLEVALPIGARATLTTPCPLSETLLEQRFLGWINAIQSEERRTIGWIMAVERYPSLHIHAALAYAGDDIRFRTAELLWRQVAGVRAEDAALVEPYRLGLNGLDYITKSLERRAELVRYSPNLAAFGSVAELKHYGKTSAERRQFKRIRKQMADSGDESINTKAAHTENEAGRISAEPQQ